MRHGCELVLRHKLALSRDSAIFHKINIFTYNGHNFVDILLNFQNRTAPIRIIRNDSRRFAPFERECFP